jgi:hypothetical protein
MRAVQIGGRFGFFELAQLEAYSLCSPGEHNLACVGYMRFEIALIKKPITALSSTSAI